MALVFGPFEEKVIDRSAVVAIGRDPALFKWARMRNNAGLIFMRIWIVTSGGGHNFPTYLTKNMSKCHAGAPFLSLYLIISGWLSENSDGQ